MVKKECLFSDACILDAMNVLHVVLSQNQVGLEHVLYDVTCVDRNTGIVTIVPGARTFVLALAAEHVAAELGL